MPGVFSRVMRFPARLLRRVRRRSREVVSTLRYRGFWPLLWYLAKSFLSPLGQLSLVNLYERDLAEPVPDVHPKVDVAVTVADGADIKELLTLARTQGWPIPRHAEEPWERCFVAKIGHEIVHSGWIREGGSIDFLVDPPIERALGSGEAYFHTAYTSRTWRGKMIHSAVAREKLLYARKVGFRKAYSLVGADNIQSRKAVERLGWHATARILFFVGRRPRYTFVWVVNGRLNMFGGGRRRVHLVRV